MLRTIFLTGVLTLVAFALLGIAVDVLGLALGLLGVVAAFSLKALFVGAVVYGVLCVVRPQAARRLKAALTPPPRPS